MQSELALRALFEQPTHFLWSAFGLNIDGCLVCVSGQLVGFSRKEELVTNFSMNDRASWISFDHGGLVVHLGAESDEQCDGGCRCTGLRPTSYGLRGP